MIDNIAIQIFDCFTYHQPSGTFYNNARSFCALAYRKNSDCVYTFNDKTLYAPKNSLVFVPSGVDYTTRSTKGDLCIIHFNTFGYDFYDIKILNKDNKIFEKFFMSAESIWNNKEKGYKYKVMSVFYDILSQTEKDMFSPKNDTVLEQCMGYISSHFTDTGFSVAQAAEFVHISEVYMRKKFREVLGISPKQYLTRLRIEYAENLIQSGYFSQTEIAEKCGYSDVKYFRTAFKVQTGNTIREYLSSLN